ncbi:hypothetical protein [Sinorhizobium meliloti]|uniref:hypothetical protein n=1 Tax=Rhizobium meliloti TaxID=382 RepID=UPI000FDAE9D1|nr:hypothetical protein [Sinorhizobium meliloti]RVO61802.1 hypothetical protein CN092_01845 [Sinorhizobium meliloti]
MQTPDWKPTSRTCDKAWHDAEGIWKPCGGPLLEWRQHHPETGTLMMTCWHCTECGNDSFKAEPAPGSPAALARAAALETSATTGA